MIINSCKVSQVGLYFIELSSQTENFKRGEMMENYKKYIIVCGLLLIFALISPVIIAWMSAILSPIITTAGVVAIIFIATVLIAWFGKIGRK